MQVSQVQVNTLTAAHAQYRVGDLLVDTGVASVWRGGTSVQLPRLSFDLLVALAREAPNLVSLDGLMGQVWPGSIVNHETVIQRIKLLRAALGDDPHAPRYIANVRGRGYRLIAEVGRCEHTTLRAPHPQVPVGFGDAVDAAKTLSSHSQNPNEFAVCATYVNGSSVKRDAYHGANGDIDRLKSVATRSSEIPLSAQPTCREPDCIVRSSSPADSRLFAVYIRSFAIKAWPIAVAVLLTIGAMCSPWGLSAWGLAHHEVLTTKSHDACSKRIAGGALLSH